jgi:aryl-alcohol dehydrogenase-like predicted oxidoreductase
MAAACWRDWPPRRESRAARLSSARAARVFRYRAGRSRQLKSPQNSIALRSQGLWRSRAVPLPTRSSLRAPWASQPCSWHRANFEAVDELAAAGRLAGRSLVSIALNWLLHHTPVDAVILGASRPAHLAENLRACTEGPLTADVLAACDQVWAKLRGPAPKYNR